MTTLQEALEQAVDHLKEEFDEAMADGSISIDEAMRLAGCMTGKLVGAVHAIPEPGTAKKEAILEFAGAAYDKYLAKVNIPWVFGGPERRIHAGVREFMLANIDGLVDELIAGYNHDAEPVAE